MACCCKSLRAVPITYLEKGRWNFITDIELDATPDQVYALLLDEGSWIEWHPDITNVKWQTTAPHSVGACRYVWINNRTRFTEEFLALEPNKRFCFRVKESNQPTFFGFNAFAEDFQLEELPNGKTRFYRVVSIDPSMLFTLLSCVIKSRLQQGFDKAGNNLIARFQK